MKNLKINFLIIFILSASLVALVLIIDGPGEFKALFKNMNYVFILCAFACTVIFWTGEALIMHNSVSCFSQRQRWSESIRVSMIGRFFDAVTPFGSGGQAVQGYIMIREGLNPGYAVLIIVIKSIAYQLAILVLSIFALIFTAEFFIAEIPKLMLFVYIGIFLNILVLLFYSLFFIKKERAIKILFTIINLLKKMKITKTPIRYKKYLLKELTLFRQGLWILAAKPFLLIKTFFYQVFRLIAYYAVPVFIYFAIEHSSARVFNIFSSQAILMMIASYVPLPGASGGTEGLGYFFFRIFFKESSVLSVILLWRIITYYSKILFGGIFTLMSPFRQIDKQIV